MWKRFQVGSAPNRISPNRISPNRISPNRISACWTALGWLALGWSFLAATTLNGMAQTRLPNFVIVYIDDMGYADIGPFGAKDYPTPNLDRMAKEGRKFTDFIVSSAVCSASRSALMTGCIHERVGITGALSPKSQIGIAEREMTLAELCKQKGYATACFGKWHLGHLPQFLPTRHGFDQYYGLPYSNDMWPFHPAHLIAKQKNPDRESPYPPLPLMENETIIDPDVTAQDQSLLTANYTQRAADFIRAHRDRPFLVYLPHTMVHVPLFHSPRMDGQHDSLFARTVMEVDWSVGQLMATLRELNLDRDTCLIFSSDNGPWLSYGGHAGSAGPLREGKGTVFEGGIRVPTLMRWPGKIPADTQCDQLASTVDILPTIAALIGAALPNHPIDGKDIRELMTGDGQAKSPHQTLPCYYANHQLQAIRSDRWKLHFPHEYRSFEGLSGKNDGMPVDYVSKKMALALYDLDQDVGERHNVAADHPDVVKQLMAAADQWREQLGDSLTGVQGKAIRPAAPAKDAAPVP
jgi:arylsulfatase A-like enzyme